MSKQKTDPFSTSVHMDLMHGVDDIKCKVFTALDWMFKHCPSEQSRRKDVLDSYGISESDVKKYFKEWKELNK